MQKKIRYIDSLRGIACIIVLVAHVVASDSVIGRYASGCGKIGVWLFMLLSGMLLIMPYLNSDKNFGLKEWGIFYKKKIIRLLNRYKI